MSEEVKDGSAAPVTSGASNQDSNDIGGAESNTVDRENYLRAVSREKKAKSQLGELKERLAELEQGNLAAEGKKDELINTLRKERDDYKSKYMTSHGAFAQGRAMDAIVDEAVKMGVASTSLLKKAVSDKVKDLDFDDEYRPNTEQVKMILESVKREEPLLFSKASPKIANHTVNPASGNQSAKPLKDMSREELLEAMSRARS